MGIRARKLGARPEQRSGFVQCDVSHGSAIEDVPLTAHEVRDRYPQFLHGRRIDGRHGYAPPATAAAASTLAASRPPGPDVNDALFHIMIVSMRGSRSRPQEIRARQPP